MVRKASANDEISFGSCKLVIPEREVYRDGKVCEIEPRCLAVLSYLIEHRARVVPKEELIETIWGTVHVSDGVVARCIMKLRQAIDESPTDSYIKTIHRVGYRFVGVILEQNVVTANREAPESPDNSSELPHIRIAVVPFVNQTGDESLAWTELGLMTLAQRSISAAARSAKYENSRAVVVPVEDVLGALRNLQPNPELSEKTQLLREMLGVDHFVLGIVKENHDGLEIQYTVLQPGASAHSGVMRGGDLPSIVLHWGDSIMEIFAAPAHSHDLSAVTGTDSYLEQFLNQAHARAIQAFMVADYPGALKLLEACRTIDPDRLPVNVDFIATLSRVADPRCAELVQDILPVARAAGDISAQVTLLRFVRNFLSRDRQWDVAQQYADQLEELLSVTSAPDLRVQIQMSLTDHAYLLGQFNYARITAQEILRGAESFGDKNALTFAETVLGGIERLSGNLDASIEHLERVDAIALGTAFPFRQNVARVELGLTYLQAGAAEQSMQLFAATMPSLHTIGDRRLLGRAYHGYCVAALRRGDYATAQAQLANLTELAQLGGSLAGRYARITRPLVALAIDDFGDAAAGSSDADQMDYDDVEICQHLGHIIALPLRNRDFATIVRLLDRARTVKTFKASGFFEAQLLHATAQLEHARDDIDKCRALLNDAIGWLPSLDSFWLVAMDQLWLAIEADDAATAGDIYRQVGRILELNWMGQVTIARYLAFIGEYEKALELQVICLEKCHPKTDKHDYLAALHKQYMDAQAGKDVEFSKIKFLPSVI